MIIQLHSDSINGTPFLVLNEKKRLVLLPLLLLHKEAPDPGNSTSLTEVPHASMEIEFPLEKWIHVGCEVCDAGHFNLITNCWCCYHYCHMG